MSIIKKIITEKGHDTTFSVGMSLELRFAHPKEPIIVHEHLLEELYKELKYKVEHVFSEYLKKINEEGEE